MLLKTIQVLNRHILWIFLKVDKLQDLVFIINAGRTRSSLCYSMDLFTLTLQKLKNISTLSIQKITLIQYTSKVPIVFYTKQGGKKRESFF